MTTPATTLDPLPRSLDPLTGESLPGYLLRLACRLSLPPARIMHLTGLSRPGKRTQPLAPRNLMIEMDPQTAGTFARTTRLTPSESTRLCLISMAGRYPWAVPASIPGRPAASPWIFTTATRYCPECLAGDGSPIQQHYGGAWHTTWRLPVIFACHRHHRLLEHLCPACQQPALSAPISLLPSSQVAGLHPAHCRTTLQATRGRRHPALCAARLDTGHHPATVEVPAADLDTLLTVCHRLLRLLDPGQPATALSVSHAATTAQYFADLRLTCGLLSAAWPASRPLFPALADAFGHHHAAATGTGHRTYRTYDTPPLDPLACGALLTTAVTILDSQDLRLLGQHLTPARERGTRDRSPRQRWIRRYQRTGHECSDGFRDALEPLMQTFHRTGQGKHGPRAPARRITFGPEHIPEQLQDDWFSQHFRHIDGIRPRLLRRAAAVRLVQMTAGGSLAQAAAYLGIDHRYIAASSGTAFAAAAYQTAETGPAEFHLAVHALARRLSTTPDLIDYQRRRQALRTWCIDPGTWQDMTGRLPRTKGPFQPELSDCKRQFASEAVWARITQGEHVLAPRIIEDQSSSGDATWHRRRGNMWHFYLADPPKPHYAALKQILHAHADRLAATIDGRGQLPITRAN